MKLLLENLAKLQDLELSKDFDKPSVETKIKELRALIPAPILGHYDRMIARGKKGIVPVVNGVCKGCQMRVAIGAMQTLRQANDLQICGICGRYLYLEEVAAAPAPAAPPPAPAEPAPPKKRGRPAGKKKAATPAGEATA